MTDRLSQPAHAAPVPARRARGTRLSRLAQTLVVGLGTIGVLTPAELFAAKPAAPASNSRVVRDEATRGIPFQKLDPALAPTIQRVISSTSVFRRLPVQTIDCDPKMFAFLERNPEVIVNIWQVMGISKVQLTRNGPKSFEANDGYGARGTVHIAYADHDTQVVYAEGMYEGSMFPKPLRAQCVLVLKTACIQEPNRRYYVTARCDMFLRLDNVGVELLARTFQPVVNKSADVNFVETAAFISTVSRTAEVKPTGMVKLANRLDKTEPNVRQEFVSLIQEVAQHGAENREILTQSVQARAQNDGR